MTGDRAIQWVPAGTCNEIGLIVCLKLRIKFLAVWTQPDLCERKYRSIPSELKRQKGLFIRDQFVFTEIIAVLFESVLIVIFGINTEWGYDATEVHSLWIYVIDSFFYKIVLDLFSFFRSKISSINNNFSYCQLANWSSVWI